MPFITEEIYQENFKKTEGEKSIHISKFEEIDIKEKIDAGDLFISILAKVRQEKTNNKKAMNAEIILALPDEEKNKIANMLEDLKDVTNSKEIKEGKFKVEFA
jgi:valyl-tRNA synthetase